MVVWRKSWKRNVGSPAAARTLSQPVLILLIGRVGSTGRRRLQCGKTDLPGWTGSITQALCRLARQYHFGNRARQFGDHAEWLYDVLWYKSDGKIRLLEIPLVAESEHYMKLVRIVDDFQKLLVARASHRVMTFRQRNAEDLHKMIAELDGQISDFRVTQPGGRYLLLGWNLETGKFIPHLIVK